MESIKNIQNKCICKGIKSSTIHIVGGYVRDLVMGIDSKDIDLFTKLSKQEILDLFPHASLVGGSERQNKLITYSFEDIEISQYRKGGNRTDCGESIEDHIRTCDFTINSLAIDVMDPTNIIDITGGLSDIEQKILRFVGNPIDRINEDPLRILRGLRFIVKYGLDDQYVQEPIIQNIAKLNEIPVERVIHEIFKIISFKGGIRILYNYGVLSLIQPHLLACIDMAGGNYHDEPVSEHMLLCAEEMEKFTNDPLMILVAFFHDIGKAVTFSNDGCNVHFYGHDVEGEIIIEQLLYKYKCSIKDINKAKVLVKYHMLDVHPKTSKIKLIKIFDNLNKNGCTIYELITLIYCDKMGNKSYGYIPYLNFLNNHILYKKYEELMRKNIPLSIKELNISGHDIIKITGVTGKDIQKIYGVIMENVLNENIKNTPMEIKKYLYKKYRREEYDKLLINNMINHIFH